MIIQVIIFITVGPVFLPRLTVTRVFPDVFQVRHRNQAQVVRRTSLLQDPVDREQKNAVRQSVVVVEFPVIEMFFGEHQGPSNHRPAQTGRSIKEHSHHHDQAVFGTLSIFQTHWFVHLHIHIM